MWMHDRSHQGKDRSVREVILAVLAAQEEYLDSIWGENMDEEDKHDG